MNNFDSIKQGIIATDFGLNLQSLLMFVPGLSLYVQIIKIKSLNENCMRRLNNDCVQNDVQNIQFDHLAPYKNSPEQIKIKKIYLLNAIIGGVQSIAYQVLWMSGHRVCLIPWTMTLLQSAIAFTGYILPGSVGVTMDYNNSSSKFFL